MRIGVALLLVACGHAAPAPKPPPTSPPPADEVVCAQYGYQVLMMAIRSGPADPVADAFDVAARDFDAATTAAEAGNHRLAAQHFLDCARRYAAILPDQPMSDSAVYDAHVCYYDAIYAFANARALDVDGRAAMKAAAAADPRNAKYIEDELAQAPADCK